MLMLFVLSSVEMYVMAAVAAAAVIALCVKPSSKGEARQYLLGGVLCDFDEEDCGLGMAAGDDALERTIVMECLDNGNVLLTRRGLVGMTDAGAVSLAISVVGYDVTIEERLVEKSGGQPVNTALFTLDFLAPERYHIHYISGQTDTAAAFTLRNRPGLHLSRTLRLDS